METSQAPIVSDASNIVTIVDDKLEVISAEQIIAAHKEVVDSTWKLMSIGNEFIEKCAVVGKLLIAKKADVGYGNFLPWIAENIKEFSYRTAADYMKAARFVDNMHHGANLREGEPMTLRYIRNLKQAIGLLEDKSASEHEERDKPAFIIRCAFNIDPKELDEHQRRDAFEQAKPLLNAFEAFGFIEIKAA